MTTATPPDPPPVTGSQTAEPTSLQRVALAAEASRAITGAIGAETNLDRILELIVQRGRALLDARSVVLMLADGTDLVVAASAGEASPEEGGRLPIDGSTSGEVMTRGVAMQVPDARSLRIAPAQVGVEGAHSAVLAPLIYRGRALGVLAAFDSNQESFAFTEAGVQTLGSFATSAAIAVAVAQSVEADRLRQSLESAEAERRRWARELHDETLQGLAGLRVLLSGVLRRQPESDGSSVLLEAVGQIDYEIANLRSIITELRPAALDELGVRPAILALVERRRTTDDLEIDLELALADSSTEPRLAPDLETAIYRFLQEALTNVSKHAHANHVDVRVQAIEDMIEIEVSDDGSGFDPAVRTSGFGLIGMRERVTLAGGVLVIERLDPGMRFHATLPRRYAEAGAAP